MIKGGLNGIKRNLYCDRNRLLLEKIMGVKLEQSRRLILKKLVTFKKLERWDLKQRIGSNKLRWWGTNIH